MYARGRPNVGPDTRLFSRVTSAILTARGITLTWDAVRFVNTHDGGRRDLFTRQTEPQLHRGDFIPARVHFVKARNRCLTLFCAVVLQAEA